jgi:hypothetical protein
MKPLAFVLLVLVGSLVLVNLPASYADSNLDTLLRIASQARDNINIQLSQLPSVPDEIRQLYTQGSGETDALVQSVSQGDQASAKNHFLSAMRIFKSVNDKISSLTPAATSGTSQIDTSQLKDNITRIQILGDRLRTIATNNNVQIDFTKFDTLMQDARQNADAGNVDQVNKDLGDANQFLLDAHHALADAATKKTSDRAKDFTVKEIQKLSQQSNSVQNVTNSPPPSPPSETNNATQTGNINDMIVKLRQLVVEGKIDEALKLIKLIDAIQNQNTSTPIPTTESSNVQPTNVNNVNTTENANPVNNSTTPASIASPPSNSTILTNTTSQTPLTIPTNTTSHTSPSNTPPPKHKNIASPPSNSTILTNTTSQTPLTIPTNTTSHTSPSNTPPPKHKNIASPPSNSTILTNTTSHTSPSNTTSTTPTNTTSHTSPSNTPPKHKNATSPTSNIPAKTNSITNSVKAPIASRIFLTVNIVDLSGNPVTGIWNELYSPDGSTIAVGNSPNSYSVTPGNQYGVYVANWHNTVFNHWDDGSTNPDRTITPTQNTTLTAFYSTNTSHGDHGNHQRGQD